MAKKLSYKRHFLTLILILFSSCVAVLYISHFNQERREYPLDRASEVVKALEKADYQALASFVKSGRGIQLSPYIYDLNELQITKFEKTDLPLLMKQDKIYNWGFYDGDIIFDKPKRTKYILPIA